MRYKPTLGGLKKAQKFLNLNGHSLSIFQMNIYGDGHMADLRWVPGKGRTISIDEAIRKYGVMCEVVDVRLTNEQGDKSFQFSECIRFGMAGMDAKLSGWDVVPEFQNIDSVNFQFKDFMDSENNCSAFLNLARWGKATISMIDRLKFRFFPKHYAAEIFA